MGAIAGFFESFLRSHKGGIVETTIEIPATGSAQTSATFTLPNGHVLVGIGLDANYQTGDLTVQKLLTGSTYVTVQDPFASLSAATRTDTDVIIAGAIASRYYEMRPPIQIGQGQLAFGAGQGGSGGSATTIYLQSRPYN